MIRPASPNDAAAIAALILPTISAGETYALPRDMSAEAAVAYWCGPDRQTFVMENEGRLLGSYFLRANQAGGRRSRRQRWLYSRSTCARTGDRAGNGNRLVRSSARRRLYSDAVQFRGVEQYACGGAMAGVGFCGSRSIALRVPPSDARAGRRAGTVSLVMRRPPGGTARRPSPAPLPVRPAHPVLFFPVRPRSSVRRVAA